MILECLDNELNENRARSSLNVLTPQQEEIRRKQPLTRSSKTEWLRYVHNRWSPITQHLTGQTVIVSRCANCQYRSPRWIHWPILQVTVLTERHKLENGLNEDTAGSEPFEDFRCSGCSSRGDAYDVTRFSRLPNILIIQLLRFLPDQEKKNTIVDFPLEDLNMDPYFLESDAPNPEDSERQVKRPFLYQCYAVIRHHGGTQNSGHYTTIVRQSEQAKSRWTEYDDRSVKEHKTYTSDKRRHDAYILFYRRKADAVQEL